MSNASDFEIELSFLPDEVASQISSGEPTEPYKAKEYTKGEEKWTVDHTTDDKWHRWSGQSNTSTVKRSFSVKVSDSGGKPSKIANFRWILDRANSGKSSGGKARKRESSESEKVEYTSSKDNSAGADTKPDGTDASTKGAESDAEPAHSSDPKSGDDGATSEGTATSAGSTDDGATKA